jgi:nitroimidazol reductase NimA-like FMN-containing flavoprotein (pyridoxamine 5'-phosphate oxidase superfamily)
MRRKDKEIHDSAIIQEILNKSLICRIALFDEVYPYIVPMNYGYHDHNLYFHCAIKGKKIDLIKKNNKVAFEIEYFHEIIKKELSCDWTTKYRSIMGTGFIDIITDNDEKRKGLDILMQQHGRKANTYNEKSLKRVVVLKLSITELSAKQSGSF